MKPVALSGAYQFDHDPSSFNFPLDVAADANNVYVANRHPGVGGNDFSLLKMNRNGGVVYHARWHAGDDTATAIKVMQNEEVYMTGFSMVNGASDIVTIKFDARGVVSWWQTFTQSFPNHHGRAWDITTDSAGNPIVVGGLFNGTDHDFFFLRYSAFGVFQSYDIKNLGSDEEAGLIVMAACGNAKVVGQSNGNIVVLNYGPTGLLSTETVNAPFSVESPFSIDIDRTGDLFVGGIINFNNTNDDYLTIKFVPRHCSSAPRKCP